MEWLFNDDVGENSVIARDTLLAVDVAEPFEKWKEEEKNTASCPDRLGINDNRFKLLGKTVS